MSRESDAAEITRRNFQTSDDVRLSFLEALPDGAGSDELTIAFIPGWSMPASLWRNQLEYFGSHYHSVALDPRGQGESDVPGSGYTAERRAADLHEFLRPFRKVLLVGWSLGAIESLQLIHSFPSENIAALALIDSSVGEGPAPPPGGKFPEELRKDRYQALRSFVRAMFKTKLPEAELDDLVRSAERMSVEASIALLSYPFERTHWRDIARGFHKPLLYVVTPQFEAQALDLRKNRAGTRIEIFRNAGHALFVDEPQRFNTVLESFARTVAK
jgi:microsomal epoxide hydrolase